MLNLCFHLLKIKNYFILIESYSKNGEFKVNIIIPNNKKISLKNKNFQKYYIVHFCILYKNIYFLREHKIWKIHHKEFYHIYEK